MKTITLRDILYGDKLPNKTVITYLGVDTASFTHLKTYKVYSTWKYNRIYDDQNCIWTPESSASCVYAHTNYKKSHIDQALNSMFNVEIDEYVGNDYVKTKMEPINQNPLKADIVNSLRYAMSGLKKDKIMSTKSEEFLNTVNSVENKRQVQRVREKKVIEIDLLTVIAESKTFTALKFGTDMLLEDLTVDGEKIICKISKGNVIEVN